MPISKALVPKSKLGLRGFLKAFLFFFFEARRDRSRTRDAVSRRTDVDWNTQLAGTLLCMVQASRVISGYFPQVREK